jgi:mono/diheme cytochrome c family protein
VKKSALVVLAAVLGAFVLFQLIPYRISNPPVQQEPQWDSARTRQLAVAACYDCHSNEVNVPWYGHVAPISWLLAQHVNDGRSALNFSEWNRPQGEGANEAVESVRNGSMPPSYFTWFGLHGAANLTPAERDELARGLAATLKK